MRDDLCTLLAFGALTLALFIFVATLPSLAEEFNDGLHYWRPLVQVSPPRPELLVPVEPPTHSLLRAASTTPEDAGDQELFRGAEHNEG